MPEADPEYLAVSVTACATFSIIRSNLEANKKKPKTRKTERQGIEGSNARTLVWYLYFLPRMWLFMCFFAQMTVETGQECVFI